MSQRDIDCPVHADPPHPSANTCVCPDRAENTFERISELVPVYVETVPKPLEHGKIYISDKFELAIHLCACGCVQETVMPFHRTHGRGWDLTKHDDGTVSFSPSVGNMGFCPNKAHYYITRNQIEWC